MGKWHGLLIAASLASGLALPACGGRSRSTSSEPQGGRGGSASGSGAGGSTSQPDPGGCAPMDAQSGLEECERIAGYAYNGSVCAPLHCTCRGSDCDRLYPSANECDAAFNECYERVGIRRSCTRHSDCQLQLRTCCGPCVPPLGSALLGTRVTSPGLRETVCGDVACDDCYTPPSTTAYAACIDGLCGVIDVTEQAACDTDADCRLVTKNCCECGGDFTFEGVMAVSSDPLRPECAGVGCDGCLPPRPEGIYGACRDVSALRSDAMRLCEVAIAPK